MWRRLSLSTVQCLENLADLSFITFIFTLLYNIISDQPVNLYCNIPLCGYVLLVFFSIWHGKLEQSSIKIASPSLPSHTLHLPKSVYPLIFTFFRELKYWRVGIMFVWELAFSIFIIARINYLCLATTVVWGWWGDWSISPMRKGWGSWACSAWRREGWEGTL